MDTGAFSAVDAQLEDGAFSGVIRVSRGGEVLYEAARGFADRANGIENSMNTRFAIASGAKGFTALGVMALVAEGTLALGASVRSVLGDSLELIDPAVTVENLLAHTSGIGDYLDEDGLDDINEYLMPVPVHRLASPQDYLTVLGGHPMKFEPGARFAYCNGGYLVLALLIEAASGSSYYEVLETQVFAPAGMRSTAFMRYDELPGGVALGYLSAEGLRTNVLHLPVRGCGDGGAFSTVDDLDRFWDSLFSGRILPPETVGHMTSRHADTGEPGLGYGLGFWIRSDRDTVLLEGFDPGISFRSECDPGSGVVYTVISNTSDGAWPVAKLLGRAP